MTKTERCKYLKILTSPIWMTVNEVMHLVIIIRICVCWPMLKSYLWAGLNWAMNLWRSSLFLVTVESVLVVVQITWFFCRANSGRAVHIIKTCRIYAYSRSASSENPKVLSTITWGFLVHVFLLLVFVCKDIQLFTDCLACHKRLVWKDRGFISTEECPEHLASICNKPLKAASKFGEELSSCVEMDDGIAFHHN